MQMKVMDTNTVNSCNLVSYSFASTSILKFLHYYVILRDLSDEIPETRISIFSQSYCICCNTIIHLLSYLPIIGGGNLKMGLKTKKNVSVEIEPWSQTIN